MYHFYIWGAGIRGQRLLRNLGRERVLAFIDNNASLYKEGIAGIPVISFEEYLGRKDPHFIIITPNNDAPVIEQLHQHSVFRYFRMANCPPHLHSGLPAPVDLCDIFPPASLQPSQPIMLYGIGLYTALMLEYLRACGCSQLFCRAQKDCSTALANAFFETFGPVSPAPQTFSGKIFSMLPEMLSEARSFYPSAICTDALFNSANAIMKPSAELLPFHNKHAGQRCFIVCTGPSLKMKDLDLLANHHELCISVNHIYKAFDKTAWRPNYYLCIDAALIKDYPEELFKLQADDRFIAWNYPPFWQYPESKTMHPFVECRYEYIQKGPLFNPDFSKGCYMGYTVTYVCLQFAVYAGFKDIYLIGCDHNYKTALPGGSENHFVKDYQQKKIDTPTYQKDKVELAYRSARQYCDAHGIHIYNATRGGKLEVFERVDFDSLF